MSLTKFHPIVIAALVLTTGIIIKTATKRAAGVQSHAAATSSFAAVGVAKGVVFEKDRGGVRVERLIVDETPKGGIKATWIFFYSIEKAGYDDIFMEVGSDPASRRRVENLPPDVEKYWHDGQRKLAKYEPELFPDCFFDGDGAL